MQDVETRDESILHQLNGLRSAINPLLNCFICFEDYVSQPPVMLVRYMSPITLKTKGSIDYNAGIVHVVNVSCPGSPPHRKHVQFVASTSLRHHWFRVIS